MKTNNYLLAILAGCFASASMAQPAYNLTLLRPGTASGITFTHADALGIDSVSSMVCGRSWVTRHNQQIVWPTVWVNGTPHVIGPGDGITRAQFNDVKNSCAVGSKMENNISKPIAWTEEGGLVDLSLPEGVTGAIAMSVTVEGLIVGNVTYPAEPAGRTVVWFEGESYVLPPAFGAALSSAYCISSNGFIVGGYNPLNNLQAYCYDLWFDNFIALPPLLGFGRAEAIGISETDFVIGNSIEHGIGYRPTLWVNARPQALPLPAGANSGYGRGVNNRGQGVGSCTFLGASFSEALFWPRNGTAVLVEDLVRPQLGGVELASAYKIADDGRIIGVGYYPGNIAVGFLITPRNGGGQPPSLIEQEFGELSQVSATLSTTLRR